MVDVGQFGERVRVVSESLRGSDPQPRLAIQALGRAGLIAERWAHENDTLAAVMSEQLGYSGLTAQAVGASLHVESVLSMMKRFGSAAAEALLPAALRGEVVGCVGVSEPQGGSDVMSIRTRASRNGSRWVIEGEKKFVTLATQADFAIIFAKAETDLSSGLTAFLVPREGYEVVKTHRLVGAHDLDTSWIRVESSLDDSHLLGRPGLGLVVLSWGLTKERLAIAAQVVGACRLALGLATAHAMRRRQFGVRLFDHQVIRLRLAQLESELAPLRDHVHGLASQRVLPARKVAGLKVTAARFGERCIGECLHIFGGDGYVEDAQPLARLWRDMRLARLGAGTDEMMLELVASGMRPDDLAYRTFVGGN